MIALDDGLPAPLGAHFDGRGVNFALFSAHATAVDLCLFDPTGRHQTDVIRLPRRSDDVWHGYLAGLLPGQLYGYRVHGPWDPGQGHRFNPHKLSLDPYAREIHGKVRWHDALYAYRRGLHRDDLIDRRDSAAMMPKGVVAAPEAEVADDPPLRRPLVDSVIYEAHVKALTQTHPGVPLPWRGTFAALGHPAVVEHLLRLGVTAIELLPVQAFVDDRFLVDRGLSNFWGYSPLNYFAPEPRYLGTAGPPGLKAAIRQLHAAGIEVLIDVVYNHTCEADREGPSLSFRGIDNAAYYKLRPDDRRDCLDFTGCGNTLDVAHPRVMQMVLDSLRHWVQTYRVDGFRFDLASSLARSPHDFSPRAAVLQAMLQDPVLSRVKLIAEPWDLGMGGYQLGGFPIGWSDWNDQFRDAARGFWRGDDGTLPRLTQGLTGSREIFAPSGRGPGASINFITTHDGYTLADVVAYERKHNEANGEENRDGHGHNVSCNYGAEGPSDDPAILAVRARQKRNMLATIVLAQGVPMLLMGDERSRSQGGNNNAYCQDNPISWVDWEDDGGDPALTGFLANLLALRRAHRALRRRKFLTGETVTPAGLKDVHWLSPCGQEMDAAAWADGARRSFGMQIGNDAPDGKRLLLLANASPDPVAFHLARAIGGPWTPLFDTTVPDGIPAHHEPVRTGATVTLPGRALLVFGRPMARPGRSPGV
ncbi:glycogen debranching enzyme GlgX [Methylobacterium sp. 4-46]|uniref:glycogen debranching protein GlgX n=1 Tax=unclassified Methylobacterium TaxID=2615210 RepID=UPI000152E71A|nr:MULTISPECIES: glycogen debranching protein GlgX [Methylobacterium]ACA21056.1 glycogen debranching enzyme GlgX [Methylobacterium sp. 4-46]WFT80205.1 glycogen debranching protein GlgX [Methylobacterium nodulans]